MRDHTNSSALQRSLASAGVPQAPRLALRHAAGVRPVLRLEHAAKIVCARKTAQAGHQLQTGRSRCASSSFGRLQPHLRQVVARAHSHFGRENAHQVAFAHAKLARSALPRRTARNNGCEWPARPAATSGLGRGAQPPALRQAVQRAQHAESTASHRPRPALRPRPAASSACTACGHRAACTASGAGQPGGRLPRRRARKANAQQRGSFRPGQAARPPAHRHSGCPHAAQRASSPALAARHARWTPARRTAPRQQPRAQAPGLLSRQNASAAHGSAVKQHKNPIHISIKCYIQFPKSLILLY